MPKFTFTLLSSLLNGNVCSLFFVICFFHYFSCTDYTLTKLIASFLACKQALRMGFFCFQIAMGLAIRKQKKQNIRRACLLVTSFSYSSANSSSIPVVHTLQFFFSFIFTKEPGYQAPGLCRFNTSDIIFISLQANVFSNIRPPLSWLTN